MQRADQSVRGRVGRIFLRVSRLVVLVLGGMFGKGMF